MKNHTCILRASCLFLFFTLFNGLNTRAQIEMRDELGTIYYDANLYKNDYQYQEGSPYLNPEFVPAKIDSLKKTELVRFDAFQGRVELMADANRNLVLPGDRSFEIRLQDGSGRIFRTLSYTDGQGDLKHSFFEEIWRTGEEVLYKRAQSRFLKEKKAEGYSKYRPPRFEAIPPVFYLQSNARDLREIPSGKKDFIAFFNNEPFVRDYLKAHRPDLDSGPDLIAFFRAYSKSGG